MLSGMTKIDGDKVRAARNGAFLSQRELAEMADLNRNTVVRIENRGILEVHPSTIRNNAKALSVDPASLTPQSK